MQKTPEIFSTSLALLKIFHYLCMAFVVLPPFIGNKVLMQFHIIVMTFTMLHWMITNGECALSDIEKSMSGETTVKNNVNDWLSDLNLTPLRVYIIVVLLTLVSLYRVFD